MRISTTSFAGRTTAPIASVAAMMTVRMIVRDIREFTALLLFWGVGSATAVPEETPKEFDAARVIANGATAERGDAGGMVWCGPELLRAHPLVTRRLHTAVTLRPLEPASTVDVP